MKHGVMSAEMLEPTTAWVDMVMTRLQSAEARVDSLQVDNVNLRDELSDVKKKLQFAPPFECSVDYLFAIPMAEDGCPPIAELARSLYLEYPYFVMAYMPHKSRQVLVALLIPSSAGALFQSRAEASQAFCASLLARGCKLADFGAQVYEVRCGGTCEAVIAALDDGDYAYYGGGSGPMQVDTFLFAHRQDGYEILRADVREFAASAHLHRHFTAEQCLAAIQTIGDCVAGN